MSMSKPIGDITAKCPRCGEKSFESPAGPEPRPEDQLTCTRCGHVVRQKDLVAQISKEADSRVAKVLGDMVKRFNKRR